MPRYAINAILLQNREKAYYTLRQEIHNGGKITTLGNVAFCTLYIGSDFCLVHNEATVLHIGTGIT